MDYSYGKGERAVGHELLTHPFLEIMCIEDTQINNNTFAKCSRAILNEAKLEGELRVPKPDNVSPIFFQWSSEMLLAVANLLQKVGCVELTDTESFYVVRLKGIGEEIAKKSIREAIEERDKRQPPTPSKKERRNGKSGYNASR